MSKDPLKLRGAKELLSRAIMHVGRGQSVDEWGDGSYRNPAIQDAYNILRNALWYVQADFAALTVRRGKAITCRT